MSFIAYCVSKTEKELKWFALVSILNRKELVFLDNDRILDTVSIQPVHLDFYIFDATLESLSASYLQLREDRTILCDDIFHRYEI